jgi:hypothetical protein
LAGVPISQNGIERAKNKKEFDGDFSDKVSAFLDNALVFMACSLLDGLFRSQRLSGKDQQSAGAVDLMKYVETIHDA